MPCYDPPWPGDPGTPEYERKLRKEFRHNSDVAEMLCGLCTELTKSKKASYIYDIKGLDKWWREHQERDKKKNDK